MVQPTVLARESTREIPSLNEQGVNPHNPIHIMLYEVNQPPVQTQIFIGQIMLPPTMQSIMTFKRGVTAQATSPGN